MYIPQGTWENSQSTTWNFLTRFQNPIKLYFCHRHKATHVQVAVWGSFIMEDIIDLYGFSKDLSSWSCFFKGRFEARKTHLLEYNILEIRLVNNVRDLCSLLHFYRCTYPIIVSFHCICLCMSIQYWYWIFLFWWLCFSEQMEMRIWKQLLQQCKKRLVMNC